MVRRFLNLVVALGLVAVGVVAAARVAEPSIRPVLYPPSASPSTAAPTTAPPTTVRSAAPESSQAPTTVVSTTTAAPVAASTTTTSTTTTVPIDEEAVLTASYAWGRSDDAVVLQRVLGVEADGWYGPATREAHLAENAARGLSTEAVPAPHTTTTTVAPATTAAPPSTTVAPATTTAPTTTPPTTTPPPSTTAGMFGGLGAKLVAQLLGQPCIADGDLSDCGPEVDALVKGLVG